MRGMRHGVEKEVPKAPDTRRADVRQADAELFDPKAEDDAAKRHAL